MNERNGFSLPGIPTVLVLIVAWLLVGYQVISLAQSQPPPHPGVLVPFALTFALLMFLNKGFFQVQPNQGKVLVKSALLIWATNVVAFAVWLWEVDRGGPFARAPEHAREAERADLLFPQMTVELDGSKTWIPGFTDYLYVSFTNATAFSPTDTMPLTARTKVLMGVESAISLLTIAVVAARAVNVL